MRFDVRGSRVGQDIGEERFLVHSRHGTETNFAGSPCADTSGVAPEKASLSTLQNVYLAPVDLITSNTSFAPEL